MPQVFWSTDMYSQPVQLMPLLSKPQTSLSLLFGKSSHLYHFFNTLQTNKDDTFIRILENINLKDSQARNFALSDNTELASGLKQSYFSVLSLTSLLVKKKKKNFIGALTMHPLHCIFCSRGKMLNLQNWNLISRFLENFNILQLTVNTYRSLKQ